MKFVKKSECEIRNGYVVSSGEVIGLPFDVLDALDKLNYMYQAATYNKENKPEPRKAPAPFEPKLRYSDHHGVEINAETPDLDKAVERALGIANDVKKVTRADKMTDIINNELKPLLTFIMEDEFLPAECAPSRLGIPEDWNIFEWTVAKFMDYVEEIALNGGKPFTKVDEDGDVVLTNLCDLNRFFSGE